MNIIKVLEDYPEVQSIDLYIPNLPIDDGKRKFSHLDDGVPNRQYTVATINLFDGGQYRIVEVEREIRSSSILIFYRFY